MQVCVCVCGVNPAVEHLDASGSAENMINDSQPAISFKGANTSQAASMLTNDLHTVLSIIIIRCSRFLFICTFQE